MHKVIDKDTLSVLNKVLKAHDCNVVLAQGSKARYLVRRKFKMSGFWTEGRTLAVGIAYGEALRDLLLTPSMTLPEGKAGYKQNGWYVDKNPEYGPVQLSKEEIELLKSFNF